MRITNITPLPSVGNGAVIMQKDSTEIYLIIQHSNVKSSCLLSGKRLQKTMDHDLGKLHNPLNLNQITIESQ